MSNILKLDSDELFYLQAKLTRDVFVECGIILVFWVEIETYTRTRFYIIKAKPCENVNLQELRDLASKGAEIRLAAKCSKPDGATKCEVTIEKVVVGWLGMEVTEVIPL